MQPDTSGGRRIKPVTNEQWLTYFDRNYQKMPPEIFAEAANWVNYGTPNWCASYGKNDAYYIKAARMYYQSTGIPLVNYER